MKVDIVMPKMGESLQEGTIIKWLKKVGEHVQRDEMILEISTDKVDTEVPSPVAGILTEILANENDTIEVGKTIAFIETEEGQVQSVKPKEVIKEKVAEKTVPAPVIISPPTTDTKPLGGTVIDLVMPKMGESLQEGTIIKWLKKIGEHVQRDEMILEISTDKVDTEIPSPVEGTLVEILASENQTVEVGLVIARITTGAAQSKEIVKEAAPVQEKQPVPSTVYEAPVKLPSIRLAKPEVKRFYSPVVKSIANENNIPLDELENLPGSGIDGRVTKNDILAYIENRKSVPKVVTPVVQPVSQEISSRQATPLSSVASSPITFNVDESEIIPIDRIRRLIAEHMVYSKHTSPHVTSVDEADVTGIVKFKEKYADEFLKREGFKLTYTPFFAKAILDAVKAFPMVNVSVDGTNIIRHKRIHLSFATALDDGNLIVPVIKNADALSLTGLARAVYDLATRARSKKLNPDDIQGGTITLTNIGTFGTLFGAPVINQPQTAIIASGAIKKRPVVKEIGGEYLVVVRDMVYFSITYDHRVIDGMLAGKCLAAIIQSLNGMNESNLML